MLDLIVSRFGNEFSAPLPISAIIYSMRRLVARSLIGEAINNSIQFGRWPCDVDVDMDMERTRVMMMMMMEMS